MFLDVSILQQRRVTLAFDAVHTHLPLMPEIEQLPGAGTLGRRTLSTPECQLWRVS
jgi:hypothetical protein